MRTLTIARDKRNPRQRTRLVDVEALVATARAQAEDFGRPATLCRHGGTVANCYGYPAWTECAVAVAFPSGEAVLWVGTIQANKATLSGAARGAGAGFASLLWDNRYKDTRASVARALLFCHAAHLAGVECPNAAECVCRALGGQP